jgi:hypothetical protein
VGSLDRDSGKIKVRIVKKRLQGWVVTGICVFVRVSRDMFYRWWTRYQTLGWCGFDEKPKGHPNGFEIDKTIKKQGCC